MTTMVRLSAALAAVLVLVFSAADAAPPLEQLLDRAMHANPDIMAARAQAELAKAEIAFKLAKRYAQDEPLDWGVAADAPEEDDGTLWWLY